MTGRKTAWLLIAALLISMCAGFITYWNYRRGEGLRFAAGLGNGINIGNSLDVKGLRERRPDATVSDFETYWHNPPISGELFTAIAASGIRSVRIPVSWGEHLLEGDIIDPEWMRRVEEVVDQALAAGLYVVLDTHHESWLIPEAAQEEFVSRRLCAIWAQIAETFAGRDGHLLFESMNEPRLVGHESEWKAGTAEARAVINRLNAAFVQTVRAAGGYNAERWLLLPAYCSAGNAEALDALELPDDERLMVAVHAYYPYSFALDEEGTAEWMRSRRADTKQLDALMELLDRQFISRKIPVVITEYGCTDKGNPLARLDWTDYYLSRASELGIPCFWWDEGKGNKIIDRSDFSWTEPDIAACIVRYQSEATPAGLSG